MLIVVLAIVLLVACLCVFIGMSGSEIPEILEENFSSRIFERTGSFLRKHHIKIEFLTGFNGKPYFPGEDQGESHLFKK